MMDQKISDFFKLSSIQLYVIVNNYSEGASHVAVTDDLVAGQAYADELNATYASLVSKFDTYPTALGKWEKEFISSNQKGSITHQSQLFRKQWIETNLTEKEKKLLNELDNYLDDNHWSIEPISWLQKDHSENI